MTQLKPKYKKGVSNSKYYRTYGHWITLPEIRSLENDAFLDCLNKARTYEGHKNGNFNLLDFYKSSEVVPVQWL